MSRINFQWIWTSVLLVGAVRATGFEMHFEQKDCGFFIRTTPSATSSAPVSSSSSSGSSSVPVTSASSSETADLPGWDSERDEPISLTTERFTVLPSSQPVSIRVNYGPFSTKQTVPVRLLVPDPLDSSLPNGTGNSEPEMIPPLDLSAHIVTPSVPKDTPILRVLFHAGQTAFGLPIPPQTIPRGSRQQSTGGTTRRHRTRLCLVAQATKSQGDVVTSSCSPDARDSTCLAELTLPIHWWPETPAANENNANSIPVKPTKIPIQVSYAVYEPENGHCNEIGLSTTYGYGIVGEGGGTKRIQIQPPTPLATVVLTDAHRNYRIIKADASDAVKLLVPQGSLYPHAKFYVPVIVGKHDHHSIVAFIMRARVKSGLRIIGIEPNVEKTWNITTDFNPRRTHATITAVRKVDPRFQERKGDGEEVFNWILEAAEEAGDDWDGGRVVWILRYVIQPSADTSWMKTDPFANFSDERHKLTTRLEVQKDDIQAVLPIAKSWEVVNTAVMNGKQVSRPMKIFIVSRAGQVADVTLQASCRSYDESVLKVSSSCTSVYVDGSEIRGSTNATIGIKYGTYEGTAQFIVWMPEFPLDIQLSDSKLSQIKGWRVPSGLRNGSGKSRDGTSAAAASAYGKGLPMQDDAFDDNSFSDPSGNFGPTSGDLDAEVRQTWDEPEQEQVGEVESDDLDAEDKFHCRPRYQHSRIEVYGRFLAQDHDSGRTSYFISRKTYLKVTDLISDYVRVSDTQIAAIKGPAYTIQGVGPGRTEVQVVSPVTGRVLGAKEFRVVNDRVFITSMKVQVSSGVQLSLFPDTDSDNEFVAETTITSKLSAKYQEALLDIKLRFSDNTWIKLDEIDRENYVLAVDSLEPTVVELPQIQNSKYPRILAVSEGGGPIMRVSLELSDQCHRQNSPPLAISVAQVEVNFTTSTSRSEFTQNDSNQGIGTSKHSFRKPSRASKDRLFNGVTNGNGVGVGVGGGVSKKELSAGLKNGNNLNVNDITGMPLRDDSSKASMPTHKYGLNVGFGPDKGWTMTTENTPLQIAIYVLLGVFSVAILVFVASCVVYASRVKKREYISTDGLGVMKIDHGGRSGATTNAHDWVWLGRASLALHPSLDSNKNSSKSVSFDTNGSSVNPIRIITNPNFDGQPSMQQLSSAASVPGSNGNGILATSQQSLNSNINVNLNLSNHSNSNSMNVLGNPATSANPAISPPSLVLPSTSRPFAWVEAPRLAPPPPRPPKPLAQSPAVVVTGGPVSSLSAQPSSSSPIDSSTFLVKTPTQQTQAQPQQIAAASTIAQQAEPLPLSPPKPIIGEVTSTSGMGIVVNSSAGSSSSQECPDYRPPVPPHRSLPSPTPTASPPRTSTKHGSGSGGGGSHHHHHTTSSNGSSSSGGGGGHKNSNNSSKNKNSKRGDPDELPNPSYVDFEPQPPIRRGENDIKRANIVGNPMCYIDEEKEDDDDEIEENLEEPLTVAAAVAAAARHKNHHHNYHHKSKHPHNSSSASSADTNVKLEMDYDQLMEYFDSLKETEA